MAQGYQTISQPILSFYGSDGLPLEDGKVYIGIENLNPETNPRTVYWDNALTQPALQPITTSSGYPIRNGSPSRIYIDYVGGAYSIIVKDKNSELVYSRLSSDYVINDVTVGPISQQVAIDAANAAASALTASTAASNASTSETNAAASASSALSSSLISAAYANMEWANFSLSDGDLIVSYTSGATSLPSLVDGEFIITY